MKRKHDPRNDHAINPPAPVAAVAAVAERIIYRKKRRAPRRDYRTRWLVLVTGGEQPSRLMVTKSRYLLRDFGVEYRGGIPVTSGPEQRVRVTPLAPLKGYLADEVDHAVKVKP